MSKGYFELKLPYIIPYTSNPYRIFFIIIPIINPILCKIPKLLKNFSIYMECNTLTDILGRLVVLRFNNIINRQYC